MDDCQLSKNFTLREMTASYTADIYHIDNTPNTKEMANLQRLCQDVLQQARDDYGKPIHVNSGFRCPALNAKVGGKKNSYHLKGMAADLHVDCEKDGFLLSALLLRSKWTDLVIMERRKLKYWIHVQWSMAPRHKFTQDYE